MNKQQDRPTGHDALSYWQSVGVPRFVYFIQAGDDGPVKIGSAKDPVDRMYNLQGANADRLHLRHVIPGDYPAERQLHQRFFEARMQGEWFGEGFQEAILLFGHALSDIAIRVHQDTGFAPQTLHNLKPCTYQEADATSTAYKLLMKGAITHHDWVTRQATLDDRQVAA